MTQRRRRGEARAAIEESARVLFATRGYQGTSLREIARHADVNEALIFRHFGSKHALFENTVVAPFHAFVDELFRQWQGRDEALDNDELVDLFVAQLYEFAIAHRDVLFTLMAAERFGTDDTGSRLYEQVARVVAASTDEAEDRGIAQADFRVVVPCVVAMVFGVVMFDSWLFPGDDRHPSREEIRRWMVAHALGGIRH